MKRQTRTRKLPPPNTPTESNGDGDYNTYWVLGKPSKKREHGEEMPFKCGQGRTRQNLVLMAFKFLTNYSRSGGREASKARDMRPCIRTRGNRETEKKPDSDESCQSRPGWIMSMSATTARRICGLRTVTLATAHYNHTAYYNHTAHHNHIAH